jgi:hypothetical protein
MTPLDPAQCPTPYDRDTDRLLTAAQDVEHGTPPSADDLTLAKGAMTDLSTLGDAAHCLIYGERARVAREAGNIAEALAWEKARDDYYAKLPEEKRW